METSSTSAPSFFKDLRSRELNGFRVRKRPHFGNLSSDSGKVGTGVLSIEHNDNFSPPLAISFCQTSRNSHLLAVSDEEGYVSIYNTLRKLPSLATCRSKSVEARVCEWVAHYNAIFDMCWIKDDTRILTASGDQTIKVWDAEKNKCLGVLTGHTGSVKSVCSHPSNPDIAVSGSRDGSFALWDVRCKPNNRNSRSDTSLFPTSMVNGAHAQRKRVGRRKATVKSITSVLYLKDDISIASASAVNSVIKFWDTRNLKAPTTQAFSHPVSSNEKEGEHGISCLSQDSSGMFLSASCKDNRIYLYDILRLDKGPISSFSGSRMDSFFVKSAISSDASHILSGSSDGNAYIWQVKKPQAGPITLTGHEGEVTAVNWCPSEIGKIATSSDDYTVRIWNMEEGCFSSSRSPSSIRRRVMAVPTMERRKLFQEEDPTDTTKDVVVSSYPQVDSAVDQSPEKTITLPEVTTPESLKKIFFSSSILKDGLESEKTPEAAFNSPSSVLNPPSSLKRTIRDYFAAVS